MTIVEGNENTLLVPTPSLPKPDAVSTSSSVKAFEMYAAMKRRAEQAMVNDPGLEAWTKAQAAKFDQS